MKLVNMCGIFALLNNRLTLTNTSDPSIDDCFLNGTHRGPEHSSKLGLPLNVFFGFHRLAINGIDNISNQPITYNNVILICNGEIYNYKELYKQLDIEPTTNSDCEVIIHLYIKYGIDYTLDLLDGVFAFVLADFSDPNNDPFIIVARDPYGVRPLYQLSCNNNLPKGAIPNKTSRIINENLIGFASEMKVLSTALKRQDVFYNKTSSKTLITNIRNKSKTPNHESLTKLDITIFQPGSYSILTHSYQSHAEWEFSVRNKIYTSFGFGSTNLMVKLIDSSTGILMENLYEQIRYYFGKAVEKRVANTDRPVACLLSGGLDSSLVTALAAKFSKYPLETYSIGLEGSQDLANAQKVADFLKTRHTSVVISEEDFLNAIPKVIRDIESYDTTTVRASVGNYLIGKFISKNSQAKVILNGDGSDELMGGYLYFHAAPSSLEFDAECRRLLKDIHAFDVLRSDKCISSHGLEPRTPFLDREWVQFYLSIHPAIRAHNIEKNTEKYLIRKAFDKENILPEEVLWRRKEAFSDGVSSQTKSWYEVIQEHVDFLKHNNSPFLEKKTYEYLPPKTDEQLYYRNIYEHFFPNQSKLIPYFWMPKFVEATDSSARTLDLY